MNNVSPTDQNAQVQQVTGSEPKDAVHFLDYWQILYSRKEITIAVAILLILTGIVITRRMPKVYAAYSIIEVQRETPNIDIFGRASLRYDPIFLRTQFEIIKSRPVIEQVVREAHLSEEFGMAYGWKATESAKGVFERSVALVQKRTNLSILQDTNLIVIEVRLDKPERPEGEAAKVATRVANTIAKVFSDYTRAKSRSNIETALETLNDEIKELDRQIAATEDSLSQIRAENGIVIIGTGDSGTEVIRRQIVEISSRHTTAQLAADAKKSKYEQIRALDPDTAAASFGILIGDTSINQLLTDRLKVEMSIAALRQSGYGDNHPDIRQNLTVYSEITQKINNRVATTIQALRLDWEQAQAEADMYKRQLDELTQSERTVSASTSIQLERLQSDLMMLKERRKAIESRMDDERINLAMPKTSVEIIQQAQVPEVPLPVSPNFALNITLSVVCGVFFGVVLAFFVEYLDTTVKTVEDIERYLGCATLGIIPQKVRLLNDEKARSKNSEVYRVLRMNLKTSKLLGNGKMLVLTSASAGEGKSTTAFNLAWVCAECGEHVLLIDADFHHPRQDKILNLPMEPGLADVAVGEATLDAAISHTAQPNLDFLPCGLVSSSGVYSLMDTDEIRVIMETLRGKYDRIIVDAPPVIGVSDTAQIIRLGDGVLLVIQHRKYPRALCRRAKDSIVSMGGNLIGAVLNNVNASHDSSSYYYEHQYYYYYYYSGSDGKKSRRTRRASSRHSNSASTEKA